MIRKQKVLIIGKIPPPIGGVTIHVIRLLDSLRDAKFNYKHIEPTKNLIKLLRLLYCYKLIHVQSSSPYYRFLIVCLCRLTFSKSIITIHGDIGRFRSSFKNYLDKLTIKFANLTIVLNESSFQLAVQWNSNTKHLGAFIPPIREETLDSNILSTIKKLRLSTKLLFSSNAFDLTYDKIGNEIYGIIELFNYFSMNKNYSLILSDPSGSYFSYFQSKGINIPENIFIINYPHSYFEVLKLIDFSIRNTTTDGDPLSVKESLFLGKPVLTTNVINRPQGCLIYEVGLFESFMSSVDLNKSVNVKIVNAMDHLLPIYSKFLSYESR